MMFNCPECGDRISGNVNRVREGADQVDYCQTCEYEITRIEDIDSKRMDNPQSPF